MTNFGGTTVHKLMPQARLISAACRRHLVCDSYFHLSPVYTFLLGDEHCCWFAFLTPQMNILRQREVMLLHQNPGGPKRKPLTHLLRLAASKTESEWLREKMASSGDWEDLGSRVFPGHLLQELLSSAIGV